MTFKERAENIWYGSYSWLSDSGCTSGCRVPVPRDFIATIAAAFKAAVEEMQEDRDRWADSACRLEKAQEKIKAEAYEACAKIAEMNIESNHVEDIPREIRSRSKEG